MEVAKTLEKTRRTAHDSRNYHRTQMQKEMIIQKLKEQGCRITKQRLMLLDIILEEEFSCCKEIYYKASKIDDKIGSATVYRMVNTLEEIGAISRKNMYKIACDSACDTDEVCKIELDDNTVIELSAKKWTQIIQAGLTACGYMKGQNVRSIIAMH
jgi:Fur family ferric uptake transcriptional regulator